MNKIKGPTWIATPGYEALSAAMARIMADCVIQKPDAFFCLASGQSTLRAYELFVGLVNSESIDISKLRVIKLDEWVGLPMDHPATCEDFVQKYFLRPLNFPADRYIGFSSCTSDPATECSRVSELLAINGPIDLCLLGLGKNGHLGLNEPAAFLQPFTHTAELAPKTQGHAMLQKTEKAPTQGMTIGMTDIMVSGTVVLGIVGEGKAEIYERLVSGKITTEIPATMLWMHPRAVCLVDTEVFELK